MHDDGWRLSGELWAKMERLLPPRPDHPLGGHNPRVPDRTAMDAILFVLRTGCQWNALNATGICSSSSAHRRFVEWTEAGVFEAFWREGLLAYDELAGIDWAWLALDGAMGKAPLGGEKTGPNPTDRGKRGTERSLLTDGRGIPLGVTVAGANRNDHTLMRATIGAIPVARPVRRRLSRRACASTRATTTPRCRRWRPSSASPSTCARAARRPGPSATPGPKPAAGWSSAPIPGSTASAAS